MTTQAAERHCGNCGKEVPADAVTCPSCGALLAAYEAPSGSDAATLAAVEPPHALPSTGALTADLASAPVQPPPSTPPPDSFSADAAIDEARRTLGMAPTSNPVTPPPGPVAEPIGTQPSGQAAKEPAAPAMEESRRRHGEGLQRQGRKLGPPPPRPTRPRAPAATTGADASRQPSRETLTPEAHPVSRPLPGFEETATAPPPSQKDHPIATVVQLAFLGVFAFFFLSIVRSFPFGVSPFIIIVFAIVILGNLMRIVARAGGRKTTTMRQPGSRSGWKR